ncbi:MAG TPA: serine/threonine-protein kinase [Thermoanaerobaculia bacterium]|nr:serine/threonine-protein kinase [Thermoanaerobaculia bacterium]
MIWSLPGEEPAQRPTVAPGEPTQVLPGPGSSPPPGPSGRLLAGWSVFRNVQLLGAGGMGRVFRAVDGAGREVAIKFPLGPRDAAEPLREARLQARVEHPGVLPVLARGMLGRHPWFSMPYAGARTLKDERPHLSLHEAVALMAEACRTVAEIHRRGIVHCDLNPRNLLVVPGTGGRRRVLVIDFGIAEEIRRHRPYRTQGVVGTPAYMAPEQARGEAERIEARTDVYGLGATLYELASGRRPFAAETREAMLTMTLQDEPRPLRELAPGVPPRLEAIVLRCLEKDPERRYGSASTVAEALESCLAS